ncbi:transitional endoplasmic reticulum ATPase [Desulfotomaculum arcticum]|uniref:Transitional endoplasmic reticulum ATPase n=1 Tax=Desulfotruncus arcticus DSM 17038 TaxID=1121424 RepID=A0A1I2VHF6_9FIRM|nr:CDC48 family AAA ATPase [Desulfotruncus arcticus]SFG88718.1 transitional endoplasmic reticulum ATPase [Desulfotomaculum arcticum] [Desulfotruncus arcticus DSM 17038]
MENGILLKVTESLTKDMGRGIARIDPADMAALAVNVGDVVIIRGKRESAARILPIHADRRGGQLIQIDGIIRENAGVGLGERVVVAKTDVQTARQVVLRPLFSHSLVNKEHILYSIQDLPVKKGDKIRISLLGLKSQELVVVNTVPDGIVLSGKDTGVTIKAAGDNTQDSNIAIRYEDIGGLPKELQRVREMIELPLKYPVLFDHLGIDPPRGVLLCGPPGTGKTLIARAVANEANAYFVHVNGPEIINKYYGESEAKLREIFENASKHTPSIIFLDELDAIAPKRQNVTGEVEKRVVAQLLALMDGLQDRGRIIIIGATNIPDALDSALRRPGRFDREITIGVPDRAGRLEILQIHSRGMPLTRDINLHKITELTNGFVGADLRALCREAAMQSLRRVIPELDYQSTNLSTDIINKIYVTMEDFESALKEVEPSVTRELTVEVPPVKWHDVGGLKKTKQQLQEAVEGPIKFEKIFKLAKIDLPRGILLHGPPGTGKTLLAKAMANEINANFISVKGPALLSKWVGESEKALRDIFRKARQVAPCIIFIDEIDALVPHRGQGDQVTERMLSQLLTEMDGLEELHHVVLLAATNRIDMIDPALLRPGRFDLILRMDLPGAEERCEILIIHLQGLPLAKDIDNHVLMRETEGFSGAELRNLCQRAAMQAIREYLGRSEKGAADEAEFKIDSGHFNQALFELKQQRGEIRGGGS